MNGRALLWLDAHFCGVGTAGSQMPDELFQEIEAIKEAGFNNAVILIDDIRGFCITERKIRSLNELAEEIKKIHPEYTVLIYGDIMLAYIEKNVFPSKVLQACTYSRLFSEEKTNTQLIEAEHVISKAQKEEQQALLNLPFELGGFYQFWQGLIYAENDELSKAELLFEKAIMNGFAENRIHGIWS